MGSLQLSEVVQNHQTGEQMTQRDMLNKENINLVALFNMFQYVICLQFGDFVLHDHLALKGPFYVVF